MENNYLQANEIGEAFQIGGDPLLVVCPDEIVTRVEYSNVISVQLGTKSREDILSLLLPTKACSLLVQTSTVRNVISDSSANFSSHCSDQPKGSTMPISTNTPVSNQYMQVNWALFQEISDVLNSDGGDGSGTSANVLIVNLKEEVTALVNFLFAAINLSSKKLEAGEDMMEEARIMLRELTELHSLMNMSILNRESIEQLLNSLLLKKPKLEAFLNQFPKDNTQCVEERFDVACHYWNLGKGKGKFKNCKASKWKRK